MILSKTKLITIFSVAIIGYGQGFIQDMVASPDNSKLVGFAKVHDGDTLKINGKNIRLYGLDAPELKQNCYDGNKKINCGLNSRDYLKNLIAEKQIFCTDLDRDKYGRIDGNCYSFNPADNSKINLGQHMVNAGWALAYRTYSPRFIINETFAEITQKGVWQYQFQKPWYWRKQNKNKH
jgi:endonuclease YncB( thermonuclease family)